MGEFKHDVVIKQMMGKVNVMFYIIFGQWQDWKRH